MSKMKMTKSTVNDVSTSKVTEKFSKNAIDRTSRYNESNEITSPQIKNETSKYFAFVE